MAATAGVVDLTNVTEGGNFKPRRKPEGEYRAKFVKADDHQPSNKDKPRGWVMTVQVEGDSRSTYPVYLNPAEKERWKIFQACRAAGLNVKNAKVRFDPNKLVGKALGVYLEDDEYDGKIKSVIGEMFPVSEVGANADEDEIVEEEEIIDEEEEEEPEPTPPPRKRTARRKPEPEPEPEDEEEELEDEEEEEPAPPPRKRTRAAAPAKATAPRRRKPAPEPEEEDEDEDLDLDDLDG